MGTHPAEHGAVASAERVCARVVRHAQLAASAWKNGGGTTREIAVHPVGAGFDEFVWRVSVADVARSGPFSRFAGIDRTLVLISGAGMRLADERGMAQAALVEPFSFARFPGELALDAELLAGPTRDFNLMLRRGQASADFELWRGKAARDGQDAPIEHDTGGHELDGDSAFVFCADGSIAIDIPEVASVQLGAMDTLHIEGARKLRCKVSGDGAAIAVSIRYVAQRAQAGNACPSSVGRPDYD